MIWVLKRTIELQHIERYKLREQERVVETPVPFTPSVESKKSPEKEEEAAPPPPVDLEDDSKVLNWIRDISP